MAKELTDKLATAVWVAKALFDRGKVTGSSGNISFRHEGKVYMSASGSSFGRLDYDSFVCLGAVGENKRPSKEYPLHQLVYENKLGVGAVIHTHSTYATLWSCLPAKNITDVMPEYTPYLKMRVGRIGLVPYAPPGSAELFTTFAECVNQSNGYLLAHHGSVVAGQDLLDAFYNIEELEENAKIAWHLRNEPQAKLI